MEKMNASSPNQPSRKNAVTKNQESSKWNEVSEIVFITFENVGKTRRKTNKRGEMQREREGVRDRVR